LGELGLYTASNSAISAYLSSDFLHKHRKWNIVSFKLHDYFTSINSAILVDLKSISATPNLTDLV